jgi:hypothetical protein
MSPSRQAEHTGCPAVDALMRDGDGANARRTAGWAHSSPGVRFFPNKNLGQWVQSYLLSHLPRAVGPTSDDDAVVAVPSALLLGSPPGSLRSSIPLRCAYCRGPALILIQRRAIACLPWGRRMCSVCVYSNHPLEQ